MKRKLPPLNSLKAFESAGHTGSFTQAGQLLNVTQSAVSRQVKQLEDLIGRQLLERKHHHLELTEAGKMLLPVLSESFDKIDFIFRAIKEQNIFNKLIINVPPTFASHWLVPRLHKLRQQYPELELSINTKNSDTLSYSNELHCAIRFGDGEWDYLESEMLFQENHVPVCSPQLLHDNPQLKYCLDGATILYVLKDKYRFQTWQHWLGEAKIDELNNTTSIEFDTLNLAIRAAMFNVGVTMADRNMIEHELASECLMLLMDIELIGTQCYWLVNRIGQGDHPNIVLFKQWLKQEIELTNAQILK